MSKKDNKAQKSLKHYLKVDNVNIPTPELTIIDKLNPGMYSLELTQQGELRFIEISHNSDEIIDLPDPVYGQVISDLESFMDPWTRKRFEEKGFVYKRSSLLYGPPGVGKTILINRIANKVIENGGTVLFNPNPSVLSAAFLALDSIQPETMTMVIFEELDELLKRYESDLLNLLDGEIQKSNIIYMATTNHIDQIPLRIRRPGRFSSTLEVHFPSALARATYLNKKLELNTDELNNWVKVTEGFSIDELTETVRATYCLGQQLSSVVERIKLSKKDTTQDEKADDDDDDCWERDDESLFSIDPDKKSSKKKWKR